MVNLVGQRMSRPCASNCASARRGVVGQGGRLGWRRHHAGKIGRHRLGRCCLQGLQIAKSGRACDQILQFHMAGQRGMRGKRTRETARERRQVVNDQRSGLTRHASLLLYGQTARDASRTQTRRRWSPTCRNPQQLPQESAQFAVMSDQKEMAGLARGTPRGDALVNCRPRQKFNASRRKRGEADCRHGRSGMPNIYRHHLSDNARLTPNPAKAEAKPRRSHACTRGDSTTALRNRCARNP